MSYSDSSRNDNQGNATATPQRGSNMDDIKENLLKGSTWRRFLYMVLFLVVFVVVAFAGFVLLVFQFFTTLITGHPNPNLSGLGKNISRLLHQVAEYLLYCTEEIPFSIANAQSATPAADQSTKTDSTYSSDDSSSRY